MPILDLRLLFAKPTAGRRLQSTRRSMCSRDYSMHIRDQSDIAQVEYLFHSTTVSSCFSVR